MPRRFSRALSGAAVGVLAVGALAATAVPAQALTTHRWAGADRYGTAATVSKESFPDGADDVVVVNGNRFPDALAAAPLAAAKDAPLLTVEAGSVPAVTLAELRRLAPQRIWVVGGASVVSDDVVRQLQQLAPGGVTAIRGDDRYDTAHDVVQVAFAQSRGDAYVASGEGFPDALAAGAAAAALGGPLVLTPRAGLSQASRDALVLADPAVVTVVGGPGVVDPAVVTQLQALLPKAQVRRLWGEDRYATAAQVALDTWESAPSPLLASGEGFPDALAGAALGAPLLLSRGACLPRASADAEAALGVQDVTGLGGTAVLSDAALGGAVCT